MNVIVIETTYIFGRCSRRGVCACHRVHGAPRGSMRIMLLWYGGRCATRVVAFDASGARAGSRGRHAVAGRVVVCARAGRNWRGGAVKVLGHVAWRRRGVLGAVHGGDASLTGADNVRCWWCVWWWGGIRAQADACSPWNAQTEGGSPCAVAEGSGCRGSSSSARGGKENPGLTTAHLVVWWGGY